MSVHEKTIAGNKPDGCLDILQRLYESALHSIKSRNYIDARTNLIKILAVPGSAVSIAQVTALRKLCLIDLIIWGELKPLPSWVSKSSPLLGNLFDGLRFQNRRHDNSDDFSPEKSISRSSRTVNFTVEGLELANPDVFCPSYLREIVRVFVDPTASVSDLYDVLKNTEQQLTTSKDWGLAVRLLPAKQRLILTQLFRVYDRIPVALAFDKCECTSEMQFNDLVAAFDDISVMTGNGVSREDDFLKLLRSNYSNEARGLMIAIDQFTALR
jgi:hypothetical protein